MFLKIRGVILIFFMATSMMLYWPVSVISRLVASEKGAYYTTTLWGRFVTILLKYIVGITYKIHGKENIPEVPCVVLSKHQSALDIFILLTVFDPQCWVFKKELFKIPFFGWALWATNPIGIDRNAGRQALKMMVDKGAEKLKNGFWVLLYPEGTRVFPGKKGTYKSGGVLLAKKAGVDIVPVAINTGLFWQKGVGIINSGVVDIVVGKPIATDEKDVKTLIGEVEVSIEEHAQAITLEHPYYLALKEQHDTNN